MIAEDIYKHFGYNWAKAARELRLGTTTITNWRKTGIIPYRSQLLIEHLTQGALKASEMDCKKSYFFVPIESD